MSTVGVSGWWSWPNTGLPVTGSTPICVIRISSRGISWPASEAPFSLWKMTVSPEVSYRSPPLIVRRPLIADASRLAGARNANGSGSTVTLGGWIRRERASRWPVW